VALISPRWLRADVPASLPSTLPTTPQGTFDVVDWAIFISDTAQPQVNGDEVFNSTLPDFMDSRRNPAALDKRNIPQPIGIIRFQGDSGSDKVDVMLRFGNAKMMANWPKAQSRAQGILWQNLVVTDTPPASLPQAESGSWSNDLRSVSAPFLLKDGRGEKFLLYDLALNDHPAMQVKAGAAADQYVITNTSDQPLHDVTFYKQEADGWHIGSLAELPSKNGQHSAATKPIKSTTTKATSQKSREKMPIESPLSLSTSGTKDAAEILAAWKQKLTAAGLPSTDENLILSILQKCGLDDRRLTAVYMLSADQMDQLLPLEVTPQPRKTVRVGLVIVRNIDPAIGEEIDDLAAQLGDSSWTKRQAAQKTLEKLGKVAKPKLEKLRSAAKDPEVLYRLDQIIAAMAAPPPPSADN
jgi:hypothetical protein